MYNFNSRLQLEKGVFSVVNILKLLELYATECKLVNCEYVSELIIEEFWKDLDYFYSNIHNELNKLGCEYAIEILTTFNDGKITRRLSGLETFEKLLKIHLDTFLLEAVNFSSGKSWNDTLTKEDILSAIEIFKEDNFDFYNLFF